MFKASAINAQNALPRGQQRPETPSTKPLVKSNAIQRELELNDLNCDYKNDLAMTVALSCMVEAEKETFVKTNKVDRFPSEPLQEKATEREEWSLEEALRLLRPDGFQVEACGDIVEKAILFNVANLSTHFF
eukprot:m.166554 g.166554  ORF g.166554 m.166554 type:complete len:132 (-) comp16626_c0_seq7:3222-3617(-)